MRIYSAFAYGATQLEKLLQSPKDQVSENLALFFRNTQKHCQGYRPDTGGLTFQAPPPPCNGELSSDEATTTDVIALSNGLKDVVNLTHENVNGAADNLAHSNVDHPSLEVDEGSGFIDCFRSLEPRDTDAAILKGDHETYFQNLKDGLVYQSSHMGGNYYPLRSLYPKGAAWEGPGRPAFVDNGRRNVPMQGGSSSGLNNTFLEAFPKHQRGTGTFFPQVV